MNEDFSKGKRVRVLWPCPNKKRVTIRLDGDITNHIKHRVLDMPAAKDELYEVLDSQPEDSTTEELVRELVFHVMVQRGLADSEAGRVVSNDEMGRSISRGARCDDT